MNIIPVKMVLCRELYAVVHFEVNVQGSDSVEQPVVELASAVSYSALDFSLIMRDKIHRSPIFIILPSLAARVTKTDISCSNELVPLSPAHCSFIACTTEYFQLNSSCVV